MERLSAELIQRRPSFLLVVLYGAWIGIGLSGCGGDPQTPTLSSLSPDHATAGSTAFTLTVNGSNFVSGATVQWNGSDRSTTFISGSQLIAAIPATDIATAGTANVTASSKGKISGALTFTIDVPANPVPVLTSFSPSSATAGGAAFNLTVNGSGFTSSSTVQWSGANRTTTYVSATQVTAAITTADIASAGTKTVTVVNPAPGGGTSNALNFSVQATTPQPVLTSLSPASAIAGGPAFTLTVDGTGFISGASVAWNGANRTTNFVSATQLTAAITVADIATAGTAMIDVVQASVRSTNQLPVTLQNPQPTIGSLSPTNATAGRGAFTITVNGTGFFPDSAVQWNGATRTTTFASSTQLTAAITAADIGTAGTAQVTVLNPTTEGGASSAQTFTITAAPSPAGIVQLISANLSGAEGALPSYQPMVNQDGTYVAFASAAEDLIAGDTNKALDIFLRSTCVTSGCTSSTSRASLDTAGAQLVHGISTPFTSITDDAGRIAFVDFNDKALKVRDTCTGVNVPCTPSTQAVSVSDLSAPVTVVDNHFWMTRNGRFIGFTSYDTNVIAGITAPWQAYVRDTCRGVSSGCTPSTRHVSIGNGGAATIPDRGIIDSVSEDGRYALFRAQSANIMPGQVTGGLTHLYIRDTCFGVASGCISNTVLVDAAPDGITEGNHQLVDGTLASFSGNARYVIFNSNATNLVMGTTAAIQEVYLRDTCNGVPSGCIAETKLVSSSDGGVVAWSTNFTGSRSLTPDGRFAIFVSANPALTGQPHIYVRDLCTGATSGCIPTTTKVSIDTNGIAGATPGYSYPSISADGHYAVVTRNSSGETARTAQVFLAKTGY